MRPRYFPVCGKCASLGRWTIVIISSTRKSSLPPGRDHPGAMNVWTALILGLVGSLHCAGMCGPLALALPRGAKSPWGFLVGRLAYNSGRIVTYCLLGLIFGLVGRTLL